jgi:hypothetical protein
MSARKIPVSNQGIHSAIGGVNQPGIIYKPRPKARPTLRDVESDMWGFKETGYPEHDNLQEEGTGTNDYSSTYPPLFC